MDSCSAGKADQAIADKQASPARNTEPAAVGSFLAPVPPPAADNSDSAATLAASACPTLAAVVAHTETELKSRLAVLELADWVTSPEIADSLDCC